MSEMGSRTASPRETGLLTIGFFALTGAVFVAHNSPASGYEVSLYTATPTTVWILFGLAFIISLILALRTSVTWLRRLSLGLGGGTAMAFVGMPVLRGYRFISGGDALTHLGWARGIRAGGIHPTELRYPGFHTSSILFSRTMDVELTHAMMLVIVALFGLFFLFVAMSTSLVFESAYSSTLGAFSAFLLLPITTLSTHIPPHAMSQAILFSSVLIYLFLKYVRSERPLLSISGIGGLFAITSISLVLYHPQLAAHLLVVFVGVCGVQFLYRRLDPTHLIANHRPVYGQTALLTAAFVVWAVNHELIRDVARFHLISTIEYVLGGRESAGGSVDTQAASLVEIGGSLMEIVLKLLGPALFFCALAVFLVVWTLHDDGLRQRTHGVIHYFVIALVGLVGLFAIYYFGSTGDMYFRVFGFSMLLVAIMGAVALAHGIDVLSTDRSSDGVHLLLVLGFGVLLVVSLGTVFPSPFIYDNSPHVTDQSMSGHEIAFEHGEDDVRFVGIRSGPNRHADALNQEHDRTRIHEGISGEEIEEGIASQYSEDRYLVVDQLDRDRELIAYRQLRYTEAQIDSIESQSGVNRVQSSGELEVYYVPGSESG